MVYDSLFFVKQQLKSSAFVTMREFFLELFEHLKVFPIKQDQVVLSRAVIWHSIM